MSESECWNLSNKIISDRDESASTCLFFPLFQYNVFRTELMLPIYPCHFPPRFYPHSLEELSQLRFMNWWFIPRKFGLRTSVGSRNSIFFLIEKYAERKNWQRIRDEQTKTNYIINIQEGNSEHLVLFLWLWRAIISWKVYNWLQLKLISALKIIVYNTSFKFPMFLHFVEVRDISSLDPIYLLSPIRSEVLGSPLL